MGMLPEHTLSLVSELTPKLTCPRFLCLTALGRPHFNTCLWGHISTFSSLPVIDHCQKLSLLMLNIYKITMSQQRLMMPNCDISSTL